MNILKAKWILIFVAVVLAGLAWFFFFREGETAARYKTRKVDRGDVTSVVSATGKVNAVVTVQVGSQVSGTIQQLFADFNSPVKNGEVVAQIDPALFEAQVAQARARLANDEANVEKARVVLEDAKRNLGRMEELLSQNLISQSEKDAAQTAHDSSAAGLKAAQAQLIQDRASLSLAETNLRYTTIRSPVDGIVISRNVDVGQTVAASLQAPTLFTIAQDLTEMQVDTSVDEADIGMTRVGQEAEFTVDAYPDSPFHGTVHDIYNQPIVVQNVVTYDAIIRVKNPDFRLKPGMTANVTIRIGRSENAIRIPNAALRYSPEPPAGAAAQAKPVRSGTVDIWVLKKGEPVRVPVTLGLSDGSFSEVTSGELREGDEVILEAYTDAGGSSHGGGRPPFMRF